MKQNDSYSYYLAFKQELQSLSDEALIERINAQVGLRCYGFARQGHLRALHEALNERQLDYSAIGDEHGLSFKHSVKLIGRKVLVA